MVSSTSIVGRRASGARLTLRLNPDRVRSAAVVRNIDELLVREGEEGLLSLGDVDRRSAFCELNFTPLGQAEDVSLELFEVVGWERAECDEIEFRQERLGGDDSRERCRRGRRERDLPSVLRGECRREGREGRCEEGNGQEHRCRRETARCGGRGTVSEFVCVGDRARARRFSVV